MTSAINSDQGLHDDLDIDSGVASQSGRSLGLFGVAQSRLLELADDGKSELVRGFDGLVTLANELAARIDSTAGGSFGDYAWQAANLLGDIQKGLRDKPVEDLLDDGRSLIRQSPAIAVGASVIAGFLVARLFKARGR